MPLARKNLLQRSTTFHRPSTPETRYQPTDRPRSSPPMVRATEPRWKAKPLLGGARHTALGGYEPTHLMASMARPNSSASLFTDWHLASEERGGEQEHGRRGAL